LGQCSGGHRGHSVSHCGPDYGLERLSSQQGDSRQTRFYGLSEAQRFQANGASVFGSQELAANSAIFTAWLQAHAENHLPLQSQYVARFTPDYKYAFDAWLATDPFTNPQAPAGPANMPQYNNP
jgi:hypothetical protein